MKDGTRYAARFKKAFSKLKQSVSSPDVPDAEDPIERLAVSVLGVECGDGSARKAVKKLLSTMVDWNEVRVSYPDEVRRACGSAIPRGEERCAELVRALNAIYDREHAVSLDRLKSVGRREARNYFDEPLQINEFASASVILWSLGGHAIPVNDRVLEALRAHDLVHPDASRAEVQAFLERHIPADKARETCLVLESLPETKLTMARTARKATVKKTATKKKSAAKARASAKRKR